MKTTSRNLSVGVFQVQLNKGKFLVMAALILILVTIFYIVPNNSFTNPMVGENYSLLGVTIDINKTLYLDEEIIISNEGNKLVAYSILNQEQIWDIPLKYPIEKFKIIEDKIITESSEGISMIDFGSLDMLWHFSIDSPSQRVIDICDEYSILALDVKEDANKSGVYLIDNMGDNKWIFPLERESVVCGGICPEKDYIVICTLEITDNIRSRVYLLDKTGNIMWAKNFDNEIITFVFFHDENIGFLKENTIISMSLAGKIEDENELSGTILRAAESKDILAICRKESPESHIIKDMGKSYLDLYSKISGKRLWSIELEDDCKNIKISDDGHLIFILVKNKVLIITRKGDIIEEYGTGFDIDDFLISPSGIPFIVNHKDKSVLIYDK